MQNWTSNKTHWANALVNIHDIYCRYSGFFLMFKGCCVIIPNTILYERLESHPLYLYVLLPRSQPVRSFLKCCCAIILQAF